MNYREANSLFPSVGLFEGTVLPVCQGSQPHAVAVTNDFFSDLLPSRITLWGSPSR